MLRCQFERAPWQHERGHSFRTPNPLTLKLPDSTLKSGHRVDQQSGARAVSIYLAHTGITATITSAAAAAAAPTTTTTTTTTNTAAAAAAAATTTTTTIS